MDPNANPVPPAPDGGGSDQPVSTPPTEPVAPPTEPTAPGDGDATGGGDQSTPPAAV